MRIGLLSDTHGYLDPKIFDYFEECDEIWHAGDFGSVEISEELAAFRPLRGVYGNIDGDPIRRLHPLSWREEIEGVRVLMTHIGGYPRRYKREARILLNKNPPPHLFICGHSHILKVMRDHQYDGMLVMNPGAAGRYGHHQVRTALRFTLAQGRIQEVDAIELGMRWDP